MTTCYYCNIEKDDQDFNRLSHKSGMHQCRKCYSKYISEYLKARPEKTAKNREYVGRSIRRRKKEGAAYIASIKQSPCTDCGKRYHPYVMDFDHMPGTKVSRKHSVGLLTSRGKKRIDAEIAKCELVCSNCHRIRTTIRRIGKEAYDLLAPKE